MAASVASRFKGETMAKVLGDLNLEDEHVTIGVTDRVREAAHRLMDVPGGVLVVLDDQERPCGIVRPDHVLGYVLKGGDLDHACCRDIMESDLLRLPLTTPLSEVIEAVDARRPAAVVALDDHGEHAGWFSPADLSKARERLAVLREIERSRD